MSQSSNVSATATPTARGPACGSTSPGRKSGCSSGNGPDGRTCGAFERSVDTGPRCNLVLAAGGGKGGDEVALEYQQHGHRQQRRKYGAAEHLAVIDVVLSSEACDR